MHGKHGEGSGHNLNTRGEGPGQDLNINAIYIMAPPLAWPIMHDLGLWGPGVR